MTFLQLMTRDCGMTALAQDTHRHGAALRLEPLDRLHASGKDCILDGTYVPGAATRPAGMHGKHKLRSALQEG